MKFGGLHGVDVGQEAIFCSYSLKWLKIGKYLFGTYHNGMAPPSHSPVPVNVVTVVTSKDWMEVLSALK